MSAYCETIRTPATCRTSEAVEFKKGFDRETIETLSAFANTRGGRVFVGISDTSQVLGVDFGKETIQNWINQVSRIRNCRFADMFK